MRVVVLMAMLAASSTAAAEEISQEQLEALRTPGSRETEAAIEMMKRVWPEGGATADARMKVCVDRRGKVRSARVVQSSGRADHDELVARIAKKWRFEPYRKRKKAVAVCAEVEVSYWVPSDETLTADVLESHRTAGTFNLFPDEATRAEIASSMKTSVTVPLEICIDERGEVNSVRVLESSGFVAYDTMLETKIAATWKFRPFEVDGEAAMRCAAVVIIYLRRNEAGRARPS